MGLMDDIAKKFPKMITNYEKVPRALMGFADESKGRVSKGFHETNYPYEVDVDIRLPSGEVFQDTIKGMNLRNALERAKINWPAADYIMPTDPILAKKAYLGAFGLPLLGIGSASLYSPEAAQARQMQDVAASQALEEPTFDPTMLFTPSRWGGGLMNAIGDTAIKYLTK